MEVNKIKNIEGSLDGIWEFQIIDQGIGMSMVDLGYMQTMAGSSRNNHKKKIINEMPQWMRPSGEFGIGLHSAFLLTKDLPVDLQSIRFDTYSYFSHDSLDIEMSSPLGGKQGYCFITKNIGDSRKVGTTTKFYIKVNFDLETIESDIVLNFIGLEDFENNWGTFEKEKIYNKILKQAPICTDGFPKGIIKDVIWDKELQVAFYLKNYVEDDLDGLREFFFKGQNVGVNDYRNYGISRYNYIDYMVDIYGFSAKNVLNISRDSWNVDFESRHSEYLKGLFEKHICPVQTIETDLLKLTYGCQYEIDFKLSDNWLNENINGKKISNILDEIGVYILKADGLSRSDEEERLQLRCHHTDYLILESENNNDDLLLYVLENYYEKYGYNKFDLKLDEKFHRYPETVGLVFYSKSITPIDSLEGSKWEQSQSYSDDESENVFRVLWSDLVRESEIKGYSFHSKYLNLTADKKNLLNEYQKLAFEFREYWNDLLILSPYQVVAGEIKLINIDDLSLYVANKKNDLSNSKEYKKLYEKLIIEIDKYKETPQ